MAIRPLDDRIVVKPEQAEERSAGGILLPDTAKEKPQRAKVVAVGAGRLTDEGRRELHVERGLAEGERPAGAGHEGGPTRLQAVGERDIPGDAAEEVAHAFPAPRQRQDQRGLRRREVAGLLGPAEHESVEPHPDAGREVRVERERDAPVDAQAQAVLQDAVANRDHHGLEPDAEAGREAGAPLRRGGRGEGCEERDEGGGTHRLVGD